MGDELQILYEDNHVLGVVKPAGMLSMGDRTGDLSALEAARLYIKEKYQKPGNVYLGLVQRLDRPVSGVMIFARTSKAASRLSQSFHDRDVEKTYLCVVLGNVVRDKGELTANIERAHKRSRISAAQTPRSKTAALEYRVLGRFEGKEGLGRGTHARARRDPGAISLLEVRPRTGRHHQIRLQLSAAGHAICGDFKYGAVTPLPDRSIALHAVRLRVAHPVLDEMIDLSAPPPRHAPWSHFSAAISNLLQEYSD